MVQTAREALADVERVKRFVVADIEDLPFVDGVVDLAMANHVLYHLRDIAVTRPIAKSCSGSHQY
jgi:ubiquinone/menaquinone biosynthesis C-methylase UbiE